MPVVFRFDSLDSRSRGLFVVPSVEAAIAHLRDNFRLPDYSMDKECREQVSFKKIKALLRRYDTVRLYDKQGSLSDEAVEICFASS
jgi:hypothetical protein